MLIDEAAVYELVRRAVADVVEDLVLPALAGAGELDEHLPMGEAAKVLGCSWDLLDQLIKAGDIEAARVGRERKVSRRSIAAYLERNRVTPERRQLRAVAP